MWNVYRHIRLDKNEPFYIGIGKTKYRSKSKHNRSLFWQRIVSKTDYEIDILFDDLTWEQAKEKEKEFIKLYGRKDLGNGLLVNMTDGGDGTSGLSIPRNKEWIKKISQSQKGKKKDPKIVEKAKITRWGENYEAEYKKPKIYKDRKGRIFTEEHKQKLSNSRKGMKFSKEHKHNLSLAKIKSEEQKYKKPKKPPRGHHLVGKVAQNAIKLKDLETGFTYVSMNDYMVKNQLGSYKKIYNRIKKGEIIKTMQDDEK